MVSIDLKHHELFVLVLTLQVIVCNNTATCSLTATFFVLHSKPRLYLLNLSWLIHLLPLPFIKDDMHTSPSLSLFLLLFLSSLYVAMYAITTHIYLNRVWPIAIEAARMAIFWLLQIYNWMLDPNANIYKRMSYPNPNTNF